MEQLKDDPRITSAELTGYAPWMQNWHEDEEVDEAAAFPLGVGAHSLKDALERYAEYCPEETVFVGSANSFFFIGKAEELLLKADAVGEKFIERFRRGIKNNGAVYRNSDDPIKRINAFRAMQTNRRRLERFTPLLGRRVLDVYPRITGGTAIIVEGPECGSYWTQEEAQGKCR